ncbi:MAG: hypothetical protein AB2693_29850 [Candidatus Thiodiazotropha sp.]
MSLSSVVQAQSVAAIVPRFDGTPTKFKAWIKALSKYGMLTACDDEKLKLLALQTSEGPLSDYIHRWLSANQDRPWADLRTELQSRFAEVIDKSYALGLLRRIRQEKDENVQIYAERLLNLAEDAFQGEGQNPGELAPIERQLVGYFTDGLYYDYLKIKVMRENPDELRRAVAIAMAEQNLRKRFNLRTGRQLEERQIEPMEVSSARPRYCRICRRQGHTAATCRLRQQQQVNTLRNVAAIQNNAGRENPVAPSRSTGNDSTMRCWSCGGIGHRRATCYRWRQQQERQRLPHAPAESAASN